MSFQSELRQAPEHMIQSQTLGIRPRLMMEELIGFHKHLTWDVRSGQEAGGRKTECPLGVHPGRVQDRVWQEKSCQDLASNGHFMDAGCGGERGGREQYCPILEALSE